MKYSIVILFLLSLTTPLFAFASLDKQLSNAPRLEIGTHDRNYYRMHGTLNEYDPDELLEQAERLEQSGLAAAETVMLYLYVPISWTAPGDDGNVGTATEYDFRYLIIRDGDPTTLSEATWNSAVRVPGEPAPRMAGSTEFFLMSAVIEVDKLEALFLPNSKTKLQIAVKTRDEAFNWSGISNVVTKMLKDYAGNNPTPPKFCSTARMIGDFNGDGKINGTDIVLYINFIFKGGPESPFLTDVTQDGVVTNSDLIYLTNYVLRGGPKPPSCSRSD